MNVSCFLPCRKGSERVPKKNIKEFAGIKNGLIEIKLNQLINTSFIDEIVLSTNDKDIINYAKSIKSSKLIIHHRSDELSSSSTKTDELVSLVYDICKYEHILWTHVTSPFFCVKKYKEAILKYFEILSYNHDSLMSVKPLKAFVWNDDGPINYDKNQEKWPRTQTLKPIYEIDSAVFLNSRQNYKNYNDRIGKKPYLFCVEDYFNFDIDWPNDFKLAEILFKTGIATI
jgi:CMP-N-acetylneuraminic acid synthetase